MVQFNFSERTIKAKVVYYGPPQSGKTTNLEQIHRLTDPEGTQRLISLNTAQDRTLFFDLLPFSLGTVSGYDFKVQLYTVPGQVQYNATRRVVLAGADAVVFVADSQRSLARDNHTAFENMKVNLLANRLVPEKVPLVLQYNKQDLPDLTPRVELDRALNPWRRKAFPATAARGSGVLETFVAIVQDMLTAIAHKYNLKEKGLDPAAVPEVVAQAFASLVSRVPPAPTPEREDPRRSTRPGLAHATPVGAPRPRAGSPARVVIAQPPGAGAPGPSSAGGDGSPVSDELLHRSIRSNVELAEALAAVVREVHQGLEVILTHTERLAGATPALPQPQVAATADEIRREATRLRQVIQGVGQQSARAGAPPRQSTGATPPRSRVAVRPPPPAPAAAAAASAGATLDALLAEVVQVVHEPLAARQLTVTSRLAPGASLPRCSPAGLRRALAALLRGLAAVVSPGSSLTVRAEKKPVLLRGRDGRELRRDFLMLAVTHTAGLDDAGQQRVLNGTDAGPMGEAYRLVREMGGFMRFAPLPRSALETRAFLPS
jgi:signal recognition particle receptor subunit beta